MPILYHKELRTSNPSEKDAVKKWYPRVKSISLASEKEVASIISDETTLNSKEAEMALAQMEKAMLILLKAGRTVRLGDWATIRVTIRAEGSDSEEECGPSKIKQIRPHCLFSKDFMRQLQNATFQNADTLQKKVSSNTATGESGSDSGGSGSGDPGDVTP